MVSFYDFIGCLAGLCTTCAFIPQAVKVVKTRSVADISLTMYLIFCAGVFLWIVYGVHLGSIPIIITNTLTFLFAATILTMKIKWNNKR